MFDSVLNLSQSGAQFLQREFPLIEDRNSRNESLAAPDIFKEITEVNALNRRRRRIRKQSSLVLPFSTGQRQFCHSKMIANSKTAVPFPRNDLLAEKFFALSERYRALDLAARTLKLHVEFAIRHLAECSWTEADMKKIVIDRLRDGVAQLEEVLDGKAG
jgi:hypothetical protein